MVLHYPNAEAGDRSKYLNTSGLVKNANGVVTCIPLAAATDYLNGLGEFVSAIPAVQTQIVINCVSPTSNTGPEQGAGPLQVSGWSGIVEVGDAEVKVLITVYLTGVLAYNAPKVVSYSLKDNGTIIGTASTYLCESVNGSMETLGQTLQPIVCTTTWPASSTRTLDVWINTSSQEDAFLRVLTVGGSAIGLGGDFCSIVVQPIAQSVVGAESGVTHPALSGLPLASALGIDANGDFTVTVSSRRFKDKIEPLDVRSRAARLNRLKLVSYELRRFPGSRHVGVIAEEADDVYPEYVNKDQAGNVFNMNYQALIPELVAGFQALQEEVRELKKHRME